LAKKLLPFVFRFQCYKIGYGYVFWFVFCTVYVVQCVCTLLWFTVLSCNVRNVVLKCSNCPAEV